MKKNTKLLIMAYLILTLTLNGCSSLNVTTPSVNLEVSETKEVLITISNPEGLGSKTFNVIDIENLIDTNGIVTIDKQKTIVEKSNLNPGETTQAKVYIIGEKYGTTVATLKISYDGGIKNIQIPITVTKPAISLFLQDYSGGRIKTGRSKNFEALVTNQDNTRYQYTKIIITSTYPSVDFISAGDYVSTTQNGKLEIATQVQPGTLRIPFSMVTNPESGTESVDFSFTMSLLWSKTGTNYREIDSKNIQVTVR